MTTIDTGRTPISAIVNARDSRTYGAHSFNPRSTPQLIGGTLKKKMDAQKRGRSLGSITGVSSRLGAPVLDLFHTPYARPNHNDGLGDEPDFNMSLVINRSIKEIAPCYGGVQMDQLIFLLKHNEYNTNTCRFPGSDFTLQCNPLSEVPPQVLNYLFYQIQERLMQTQPLVYRKGTPQDLYKDYVLDGIAEHVAPMQNRATVFADCESDFFGTNVENPGACAFLVTMLAKGVARVVDYWGANVQAGAHLYYVLRKFDAVDYEHDYKNGKLTLTNQCAKVRAGSATNDSTTNPFTPYQIAFFALPFGGPVPVEYTRYYDEERNLRTDAVVVYVGKVTECPPGHIFRPSNDRLKPYNGSLPNCRLDNYSSLNDSMVNHSSHGPVQQRTLKIILNPDDGVRTM